MHSRRTTWGAIALAAFLLPATVGAQSRERPAIVMGAPTFMGVLIPVSPGLAFRPDLGLSVSSLSRPGSTTKATSVAFGLSTLHYLGGAADGARPYLTPRIAYGTTDWGEAGAPESYSYSVAAAFGAQATVSGRLGVFAEAGVEFDYSQSEFGGITSTSRGWSTTTRIGAMFRF